MFNVYHWRNVHLYLLKLKSNSKITSKEVEAKLLDFWCQLIRAFKCRWANKFLSIPSTVIHYLYNPYQLKHEISHDVQGLHRCRWYKIVKPCLSTCTLKLVDYLHVQADKP